MARRNTATTPGWFRQRKGSPYLEYRTKIGGRLVRVQTAAKTRAEAEKAKSTYYTEAVKRARERTGGGLGATNEFNALVWLPIGSASTDCFPKSMTR